MIESIVKSVKYKNNMTVDSKLSKALINFQRLEERLNAIINNDRKFIVIKCNQTSKVKFDLRQLNKL